MCNIYIYIYIATAYTEICLNRHDFDAPFSCHHRDVQQNHDVIERVKTSFLCVVRPILPWFSDLFS